MKACPRKRRRQEVTEMKWISDNQAEAGRAESNGNGSSFLNEMSKQPSRSAFLCLPCVLLWYGIGALSFTVLCTSFRSVAAKCPSCLWLWPLASHDCISPKETAEESKQAFLSVVSTIAHSIAQKLYNDSSLFHKIHKCNQHTSAVLFSTSLTFVLSHQRTSSSK